MKVGCTYTLAYIMATMAYDHFNMILHDTHKTVSTTDNRVFIYSDALLANFSIDISNIKTVGGKMASASDQSAAMTLEFSQTNHRSFNSNH